MLTTTSESLACQRDIFTKRFCGVEDCLHLNVYTKQKIGSYQAPSEKASKDVTDSISFAPDRTALLPVMVFFHGGAFMFGSNAKDLYNPEYLLRKDVVVVAVNYRLGAFGELVYNLIKTR